MYLYESELWPDGVQIKSGLSVWTVCLDWFRGVGSLARGSKATAITYICKYLGTDG